MQNKRKGDLINLANNSILNIAVEKDCFIESQIEATIISKPFKIRFIIAKKKNLVVYGRGQRESWCTRNQISSLGLFSTLILGLSD